MNLQTQPSSNSFPLFELVQWPIRKGKPKKTRAGFAYHNNDYRQVMCNCFTWSTMVCPSENDTSESDSAIWLSCRIVNLDKRSTDLSNFKDDKFENSDIRIPRKSSLFKAQRVPFVTARTEACSGLLYLQCQKASSN